MISLRAFNPYASTVTALLKSDIVRSAYPVFGRERLCHFAEAILQTFA